LIPKGKLLPIIFVKEKLNVFILEIFSFFCRVQAKWDRGKQFESNIGIIILDELELYLRIYFDGCREIK